MDGHDAIYLLNMMPTSDKDGQKFNRVWGYNNFTYGLKALVLQKIKSTKLADYMRTNILNPLSMIRTAISRSDIVPYVTLARYQLKPVLDTSWPCENNTLLLAATGVYRSVSDMLRWCTTVLEVENREVSESAGVDIDDRVSSSTIHEALQQRNNPLEQMRRIRRGYWTRPADDPEYSKPAA